MVGVDKNEHRYKYCTISSMNVSKEYERRVLVQSTKQDTRRHAGHGGAYCSIRALEAKPERDSVLNYVH